MVYILSQSLLLNSKYGSPGPDAHCSPTLGHRFGPAINPSQSVEYVSGIASISSGSIERSRPARSILALREASWHASAKDGISRTPLVSREACWHVSAKEDLLRTSLVPRALVKQEDQGVLSDDDEGIDGTSHDEEDDADTVEKDSLSLLEWPSVCAQVAKFASTPLGIELARQGKLPFGTTQEDSEELLAQTAAACLLPEPLDFSGIVDVQPILRSASARNVCTIKDLCTVQKMLCSVRRVCEQLQQASATILSDNGNSQQENHHAFLPLQTIMASVNLCTSVECKLRMSLDSSSFSILDTASPGLATIRAARQDNMKALESLLMGIGEKIVEAGGMDSVIVTNRRSRVCVAVRASYKHLLRGGVVLDVSNSGATLFMEPKAALELNNKEVQLSSQEKAEEFAVLENLTCRLADVAEDIWILLQKVTFLDLACARADYAKWLGAVKPAFVMKDKHSVKRKYLDPNDDEMGSFSVYINGLSHPLLLEPALNNIQRGLDPSFPVPVDFKVKFGVRVVVVSGPNTGGKTASMKTLGVAALMAKAGLFLPAKGKAILPWFDKVLADIGDNQSLEQSLSTFSGHIQQVRRIIEAGGAQSLVLYDEIGSGTDPSEGAALATAILQHMAEHAHLTVVTTHFSKLSSLKGKDKRFEVASVEFDIETLRPKYTISWGTAGQSNALDIASSLGVDESILARARHWMKFLAPENHEERVTQLMNPLMEQRELLQSQVASASLILSDARKLHDELAAEADGLDQRIVSLRLQQEESVKKDILNARAEMDEIVSNYERLLRDTNQEKKTPTLGDAIKAIASVVESYMEKFGKLDKNHTQSGVLERPSVGDLVHIKKLGKNLATVVESAAEDDDSLLVQLGSLKARVKLNEVAKIVKQEKVVASYPRNKVSGMQGSAETLEMSFGAAVQTSRNTVDLRGLRVDSALLQLDVAIQKCRRMSVLFVVHGEGTGAVRSAVLQKLKGHPRVAKFEQESPMNFGCTVVYVK